MATNVFQCVEHIVYFQIIISFIFGEKHRCFGCFGHTTLFFLSIDAIDTTETSQKLVFTTDTHVFVDVVVIIERAAATYRKNWAHETWCILWDKNIQSTCREAKRMLSIQCNECSAVWRVSEGVVSLHGCRILISNWVPAAARQRTQQPNTKSKC